MIVIFPLIVFVVCLGGVLFAMYKYEHKFAYPVKELLIDLIGKNQAFYIPPQPIHAEHREEPLYYKIEFSKIYEKGLHMELSRLMAYFIRDSGVSFDRLIGVESKQKIDSPIQEKYTIVPILSAILGKPYAKIVEIVKTNKFICEGEIVEGETAIIIDDVLTTGASIISATEFLRKEYPGIRVTHAFTFAARYPYDECGLECAKEKLMKAGVELVAIVDNISLVSRLYERKYINLQQLKYVSNDRDLQGSDILKRFEN
jgi:orotate phosphoribosyltransferase-like protein